MLRAASGLINTSAVASLKFSTPPPVPPTGGWPRRGPATEARRTAAVNGGPGRVPFGDRQQIHKSALYSVFSGWGPSSFFLKKGGARSYEIHRAVVEAGGAKHLF